MSVGNSVSIWTSCFLKMSDDGRRNGNLSSVIKIMRALVELENHIIQRNLVAYLEAI